LSYKVLQFRSITRTSSDLHILVQANFFLVFLFLDCSKNSKRKFTSLIDRKLSQHNLALMYMFHSLPLIYVKLKLQTIHVNENPQLYKTTFHENSRIIRTCYIV
jgi:hypothetical protein